MNSSKQMTAIVIDDDDYSRLHMQELLHYKTNQVELLAVANNAESGLQLIRDLSPDIVFLDIEMPDMNGFELLRKLPFIDFDVIFTTAHEHHAIRAIKFSAIDYLVKPIDTINLQEAIARVIDKRAAQKGMHNGHVEVFTDRKKKLDNLAIPTLEGLVFLGLNDIVYCEGSDKYTRVFLIDGKIVMSSKTLGGFEEQLEHYNFYRIHKSHLINLNHLKKYIRGEGGQVCLTNGSTLDVSRRKRDGLLRLVSQL